MVRFWILLVALLIPVAPVLADKPAGPAIVLDITGAPELKAWGEKAKGLCEKWRPRVAEILGKDGDPDRAVTLVFKKEKGVAYTSGARITVSSEWVAKHPDDFGMVIHELAHVVQAYPKTNAGWLVEGIADYVRYYHFEPDSRRFKIGDKASYKDGYGTAAAFLAWSQKKYDKKLVIKLNAALREGKYKDELFREITGKPLDTLWKAFVADQK